MKTKAHLTAKVLAAIFLALLISGCASHLKPAGPPVGVGRMDHDHWLTADGVRLPIRAWETPGRPKAVILALHGMNDYSNFFDEPGKYLAGKGIAAYAYDQRGFGQAPDPGYWSDAASMVADLREATRLVAARNPGVPLYLLGESMGGAVVMLTASGNPPPEIEGVILSAPAVWGRSGMGGFQRAVLWLANSLVPGMELTGQGLKIRASDNIEMLRALGRDPLVLKKTRVDAINGVVDLMDAASAAAPGLAVPALVLYGARDEIIPPEPTWRMVESLPGLGRTQRAAYYAQGWHMLLRDLQAKVVLNDIAAWISDHKAPLPSGADLSAMSLLARRRIADGGA